MNCRDFTHKVDISTRKLIRAKFNLTINDCEFISNGNIVWLFDRHYKLHSPISDFNPIGITELELIEVLPHEL